MASQKEMDDILALASELDMDVTEDEQGESWMGTGGVLSPSAVPVAPLRDGLDTSRRVLTGSADSSPVGLFVYDTQAGVEGPCGGTIGGVSGRFCCVPESACSVQSHSQKRFDYGRARLHKMPKRNGSVLLSVVELGRGCTSRQGSVGG